MDNTSRIKGIAISLENFSYDQENDFRKNVFVGREKERERLKSILTPHPQKKYSGVYLVTGYRGMGKTSLVKKVISEIKTPTSHVVNIEVSLAHDELKELDVLRTLLKSFQEQIEKEKAMRAIEHFSKFNIALWFSIAGTLCIIVYSLYCMMLFVNTHKLHQFVTNFRYLEFIGIALLILLFIVFYFLIKGLILTIVWYCKGFEQKKTTWRTALKSLIIRPLSILKPGKIWSIHKINQFKIRLDQLIDRATSNVNIENDSVNRYGKFKFNIFTKRVKSYQIEDARSIEYEFKQILEGFVKYGNYNIIFVLDELDKVNPIEKIFAEHSDDNHQRNTLTHEYYEKLRRRQERTIKTISNLKYLFSASDAKFIFIAGREMFDASLADISDRESALGSIFTDVIYVSSFMTESFFHGSSNITKLTINLVQEYITQKRDKNEGTNYIKLIDDHLNTRVIYNGLSDKGKNKILSTIQNFVVYLTYRSAGAPKKIKFFFEQNVLPYNSFAISEDVLEHTVFIDNYSSKSNPEEYRRSENKHYLYFTPNDQYRFGLTTYLFTPFIVANSTYMKNYGDKLLVSTSYLLDHLYKFHSSAFSTETLELIPEIIAINKSPDLRGFINQIINNLKKTHIRSISNGLHRYRFDKTIEMEIRYLSKMSETDSAAFNFTLDESLQIKRYYKDKLNSLITKDFPSLSRIKIAAYVADLHFYDQEYDDAQHFYLDALSHIKGIENVKVLTAEELTFYVRIKLKSGLTYERMRLFEEALSVYNDLISKTEQVIERKDSVFNFTSLLYQSLLAKLTLYEKTQGMTITQEALNKTEKLFRKMVDAPERLSEFMEAEFYKKLGNVLFFKNSAQLNPLKYYEISLKISIENYFGKQMYLSDHTAISLFLFNNIKNNPLAFINERNDHLNNIATCLSNIGNYLLCNSNNSTIFDKSYYENIFNNYFKTSSWFFKKNGDGKRSQFQLQKILYVLKYCNRTNTDPLFNFQQIDDFLFEKDDNTQHIGLFKSIVKEQYKTNGSVGRNELNRFLHYKDKIKKVSQLKTSQLYQQNNHSDETIESILSKWIPYLAVGFETKTVTLLVQWILFNSNKEINDVNINFDISEFEDINNKINRMQELNLKSALNYKKFNTISEGILYHFGIKNNLEIELDQQTKLHKIEDILGPKISDEDQLNKKEMLISLVIDSVFCNTEIIRIFKTMGESYINSYSFLASTHKKLAEWSLVWEILRGIHQDTEYHQEYFANKDKTLTNLIGINSYRFVDSYYHYEQALVNYYNEKSVHRGGERYKELLHDMYYLEDDFHEDTSLFCAALCRNKINDGTIDKVIKEIKQHLESTRIYDFKNYVNYEIDTQNNLHSQNSRQQTPD